MPGKINRVRSIRGKDVKMGLDFVSQGDVSVCFPQGKLDLPQSLAARKKISALMEEGVSKIIFDFSALEGMSSTGMRVFISSIRELNENHGRAVFCAPSNAASNWIEMAAFENDCKVYPTLFEALLAVQPGK